MIKKILILIILSGIILGAEGYGFAFLSQDSAIINVDGSQVFEKTSDVIRPSLMGSWWNDFNKLETEIIAIRNKPVWRFHLGLGTESPGGDSELKPDTFEADFDEWLRNSVDPQIKKYREAGYQVVISITNTPRWLSLYPSDEILPFADGNWFLKWAYSPPKDYAEWESLIRLLIQTQKEDGIQAEYIVWDEPDWMFYGIEEQYLELYKHTVTAIKDIDQTIKVGGPGVGCWACTKDSNCPAEATGLEDGECPPQEHSMIESLIQYVAENSLPLDFIDWHFPNLATVKNEVNITRQLLRDTALPETIPLTIGEWVFSSKGEEESTEKASAYAIHLMKSLHDSGISRHTATSIYDQSGWISGHWAHVGFFSSDGVIKAKWNAFEAIDRLSGQMIYAETTDESHIAVLSTKDAQKISVVASHFITQDEVAFQAAKDSLSVESINFIDACAQSSAGRVQLMYDAYKRYLSGVLTIEQIGELSTEYCGSFPEYLESDLLNSKEIAYQVYEGERPYTTDARDIELKITNITPGTYTYRRYLIDGDINEIHSNPCRYNKKTEPVPTDTECGINGALDQAVNKAKEDATSAANDFLLSLGYSETYINRFLNCYDDPACNLDPIIKAACKKDPANCEQIVENAEEYQILFKTLFQHGVYTASNGQTYTIPVCIDQINNMKGVSLEGSKQEKQITITDGTYNETLIMQPYSVILIEIAP